MFYLIHPPGTAAGWGGREREDGEDWVVKRERRGLQRRKWGSQPGAIT